MEISFAEPRTIRDRLGRVVEKASQNKDRERCEGIRELLICDANSIPKGVILRHTGAQQEEMPQKACQPPRPGAELLVPEACAVSWASKGSDGIKSKKSRTPPQAPDVTYIHPLSAPATRVPRAKEEVG